MVKKIHSNQAGVVFVGAGPIGLWTAAQIKIASPSANIAILEKHSKYQRSHVLRIASSSLPRFDESSPLHAITEKLRKKKIVPTREIENDLLKVCRKLGISILHRNVEDPKQIAKDFPMAKVIIGADGSHSVMREYVCDGKFSTNEQMHYLAEVKYEVEGDAERIPLYKTPLAKSAMRTYATETVGKKDSKTKKTPVTLRLFIDKKTYEEMKMDATFKTPLNLESSHKCFNQVLKKNIELWLEERSKILGDRIVKGSERITVTSLGYYVSDKVVKHDKNRTYCLVGDAAFGVPFFRSLNNGLICGTKLAAVVSQTLTCRPVAPRSLFARLFKYEDSFDGYQKRVISLARWEVTIAKIKSLFIRWAVGVYRVFSINIDSYRGWSDSWHYRIKPMLRSSVQASLSLVHLGPRKLAT